MVGCGTFFGAGGTDSECLKHAVLLCKTSFLKNSSFDCFTNIERLKDFDSSCSELCTCTMAMQIFSYIISRATYSSWKFAKVSRVWMFWCN